ncbi:cilia- and flagella-associated protein 77 isoform X2 [Vanacampus margaritifer]
MTSPGVGGAGESTPIKEGSEDPPSTSGVYLGLQASGGVADALSRWRVQSQLEGPRARHPPVLDFVGLNREAVKCGHVTSKQLKEYKAQMGVAKHSSTPKRTRAQQQPQIPDITFGLKSRAPSPLFDILAHEYARRWMQENMKVRSEHERRHAAKCLSFGHTRTSLMRSASAPPHVNTHTHTCARYAQVGPALDTFRNRRAKPQANKSAG